MYYRNRFYIISTSESPNLLNNEHLTCINSACMGFNYFFGLQIRVICEMYRQFFTHNCNICLHNCDTLSVASFALVQSRVIDLYGNNPVDKQGMC